MISYCSVLESPIGRLTILADDEAVNVISFAERDTSMMVPNALTILALHELHHYFEGKLTEFSFPMAQSGTPFQQEVWQKLLQIPYAETCSYAQFSAHQPLAIRAIAAANGRNNLAIAVPCHRVIGSNGKLVGYAGGLWRKKWLLQHEREVAKTGQTELKF